MTIGANANTISIYIPLAFIKCINTNLLYSSKAFFKEIIVIVYWLAYLVQV